MATTIALAYYNLSTMLDAGVPLVRSLNSVAEGLKPPLQQAFLDLADGVSRGDTLAETMVEGPRRFEPLDIMLVRGAEKSGSLPETLGLLSKWHEFSLRLGKRMRSGMVLPVFLIHATAFVAPLTDFFLGGWQLVPYFLSVAKILSLFYIPAAVVFIVLRFTPGTGSSRRALDYVSLQIPVLRKAVYHLALSRYCWVFHILFKAGVPITDCAETAASSTSNAIITDLVKPAAESAKAGGSLFEGFSQKLPLDFLNVWQVGEETGKLDDLTKRLADSNGETAEFWFEEFARWLPRLVYVLVCILSIYYIARNLVKIMSQYASAV